MNRRVSRQKKIAFGLTVIFCTAGLMELVLTLSGFQFDYTDASVEVWIENSNRTLANDSRFRVLKEELTDHDSSGSPDWFLAYDQELLWKPASPNAFFHITARGLRGLPFPLEKADDEYRILILGGSCAWGYGVRYYDSFAYLLEKYLNVQLDRRCRVLNAGVPGYSSTQGRLYFDRKLGDVNPDLVIIYFGRNDSRIRPAQWKDQSDTDLLAACSDLSIEKSILQRSRIYQAVSNLIFHLRHRISSHTVKPEEMTEEIKYLHQERLLDDNRKRVSKQQYIDNIQAIRAVAADRCARVLLLTSPVNPDIVGNYNPELREISRKDGVLLLDLAEIFSRENRYPQLLIDECHPSRKGHRLIAGELKTFILDSGIIVPGTTESISP